MPKVTLGPATQDNGPTTRPHAMPLPTDAAGITGFGAQVEVLPPGARTDRQAGQDVDAMVYMLAGEVVLIEGDETRLRVGDAACWPAGFRGAHWLENRGGDDAMYLVVFARDRSDPTHIADTAKRGRGERHERPD